jgi:UDP-glucose 4-epimerase
VIGVIGSRGFLGRTVIDQLVAAGIAVRAYARPAAGPVPAAVQAGVVCVPYDLTDSFDPAAFDGIDTLILLASATRPNSPGNTALSELALNVTPHLTLFQGLKGTGVRHLIYLSSGGAVYGDRPSDTPVAEDEHCRPADPYGFGKLCIETALALIWQGDSTEQAGRRATIIRPANPVGRHQLASVGAHGLVTTVLHHLRQGLPVTVQGDGAAVRDYFAATDLADLILRAAQQPPAGPVAGAGPVVVNAGSGRGLTILQVIDLCAAHLRVRADIRFNPGLSPVVRCNVLQTRRAKALFGWQPQRGLPDILAELTGALAERDQRPL